MLLRTWRHTNKVCIWFVTPADTQFDHTVCSDVTFCGLLDSMVHMASCLFYDAPWLLQSWRLSARPLCLAWGILNDQTWGKRVGNVSMLSSRTTLAPGSTQRTTHTGAQDLSDPLPLRIHITYNALHHSQISCEFPVRTFLMNPRNVVSFLHAG